VVGDVQTSGVGAVHLGLDEAVHLVLWRSSDAKDQDNLWHDNATCVLGIHLAPSLRTHTSEAWPSLLVNFSFVPLTISPQTVLLPTVLFLKPT